MIDGTLTCIADDRHDLFARRQAEQVRGGIPLLASNSTKRRLAGYLRQRRRDPCLVFLLPIKQTLGWISLALIVHHLVVDPAEQDEVFVFIQPFDKKRLVESRPARPP